MQVGRLAAAPLGKEPHESVQQSHGLVFHSSSEAFDRLIGLSLLGAPLHHAITQGTQVLNELYLVAEESGWDLLVAGPLSSTLITCCDSAGMEFDCEVRP
eukprot:5582851-Amphidinium_carterae.1